MTLSEQQACDLYVMDRLGRDHMDGACPREDDCADVLAWIDWMSDERGVTIDASPLVLVRKWRTHSN